MSKKTAFKSSLFVLMMVALLLFATVGVAYAGSGVKKKCFTQNWNGSRAAKVCVKGTLTWSFSNGYIHCSNPTVTKTIYQSGITIQTLIPNYCFHFTQGGYQWAGFQGKYRFKRLGVTLSDRLIGKECGNTGSSLVCVAWP